MSDQDEFLHRVELSWLLAFYGGLLTEKQRSIVSMHCDEDMTLSEIAQVSGITRQGAHEQLTRACERLTAYEEKLGVVKRFRNVQSSLEECLRLLRSREYDQAEILVERMIQQEQEENDGL